MLPCTAMIEARRGGWPPGVAEAPSSLRQLPALRPTCLLVSLHHYCPPKQERRAAAAGCWGRGQRGRAGGATCAFTGGDSPAAPEALPAAEVERRLSKACNLIKTSNKLIPYDSQAVNLALVIWQAIRDIPEEERVRLVSRLSSSDIRRLWTVAGQRYSASAGAVMAAIGPEYSVWKDLPGEGPGEVVLHRGRAALPLHALGVSSFTKAFFQRQQREEEGEGSGDELFGRVIHPTPVANWLYPGPLYFRCRVGTAVVPILGEACDMTISYQDPLDLGLTEGDIPRGRWPRPRRQRRPFDCGFTDYVRAAGPGVMVGLGYRREAVGSGVPLVPSPLHFVMAVANREAPPGGG